MKKVKRSEAWKALGDAKREILQLASGYEHDGSAPSQRWQGVVDGMRHAARLIDVRQRTQTRRENRQAKLMQRQGWRREARRKGQGVAKNLRNLVIFTVHADRICYPSEARSNAVGEVSRPARRSGGAAAGRRAAGP